MPTPQIISCYQGETTSFTVEMQPPTGIAGWQLEFRAKSNAVNPPILRGQTIFTQLADDMAADTTVMTVNTKIKRFPMRPPFYVRVDDEVMFVTKGYNYWADGQYNYDWAVERGKHGTTASTHATQARVELFNVPQLLLNNGSLGGIAVEDEDNGVITITLDAAFTMGRPVGTYFWVLRRTDPGLEKPIAQGVLYLIPSAQTALQEPPL